MARAMTITAGIRRDLMPCPHCGGAATCHVNPVKFDVSIRCSKKKRCRSVRAISEAAAIELWNAGRERRIPVT